MISPSSPRIRSSSSCWTVAPVTRSTIGWAYRTKRSSSSASRIRPSHTASPTSCSSWVSRSLRSVMSTSWEWNAATDPSSRRTGAQCSSPHATPPSPRTKRCSQVKESISPRSMSSRARRSAAPSSGGVTDAIVLPISSSRGRPSSRHIASLIRTQAPPTGSDRAIPIGAASNPWRNRCSAASRWLSAARCSVTSRTAPRRCSRRPSGSVTASACTERIRVVPLGSTTRYSQLMDP